ncbi:MAG: hypothetical protein ACQERN_00135 [Thermodesulfobacteriota bacterium]
MEEPELFRKIKMIYYRYLWWPWQIILVLFAFFFLYVGIELVIHAYRLNDPFDFIMCFFASNLIILISLVLVIGFVYRMVGVYRIVRGKSDRSPTDINES